MAIFPKASLIMTAAAFFVVRKYFSETLTKNLSAGDIVAMIVRMYPRLVQGSSNIHRYSFRSQNNYEKIYFFLLITYTFTLLFE